MGDMTANFSRKEFECQCGCGADNISEYVVKSLQRIRDAVGAPMTVTSGIRCKEHNKAIGGVSRSSHVPRDLSDGEGEVGHAVDIACDNSVLRYKILKASTKYFMRIGIGENFIHLDNDTSKPQTVAWDYYQSDHKA